MPTDSASDILLIQLGSGAVGSAVTALVEQNAHNWRQRFGLAVEYAAIANSRQFTLPATNETLPITDWKRVLEFAIEKVAEPGHVIVVDCAVGNRTAEMLLAARAAGGHLVLCNKDALVGPHSQFAALSSELRSGSLRLSATVGAGLPITSAIIAARATGDPIFRVEAVCSGTLGYLCSTMMDGTAFPQALQAAIDAGYCEPDPRIDLSGYDVARKLLILARLTGHICELEDVEIESLIPPGAESLSQSAFLKALPSWGNHLAARVATARTHGNILRYVGELEAEGRLHADLREVAPGTPLAQGSGPDNVFVAQTGRYRDNPLIIAGPGAGVAVTAGAVVGDILRAAGQLYL